jgi:predicted ATPase
MTCPRPLAELSREPIMRRLSLGGLSEPEVAQYLELTASAASSPVLAATLYEKTEGNPLFIGEIVRLLAVEADRSTSRDAPQLAIPQSVRDVIARRLTYLTEGCSRVMLLASVLGGEFAVDVLARMADCSEPELLDALDEASRRARRLGGPRDARAPPLRARVDPRHALRGPYAGAPAGPARAGRRSARATRG